MITTENRIMLAMLADVLHERQPQAVDPALWLGILEELKVQTVHGLIHPQAKGLGLEEQSYKEYLVAAGNTMRTFHIVLAAQNHLLQVLETAGIPAAVLKGTSAAMSYPHPEFRSMGDIDILVPRERFEEAYHILIDAGYHAEESLEDYKRHIGFKSPEKVKIELHEYFSSSSNEEQNKILDEYIFSALPNVQKGNLFGNRTAALPPLENGLVLLGHINQHLGSGLGLRQIIDWMCYVEKYLDDELWNGGFAGAAEAIGMKQLAVVTTLMCSKYLGMVDRGSWYREQSNDSIADELMEYVLAKGNFGRKDSGEAKSVSVIRIFRNPVKGFAEMQKTGCRTWKALKKYPFLKPFAWAYQLIRWIRHGLQKGVKASSVSYLISAEEEQTAFLERLGVTRL